MDYQKMTKAQLISELKKCKKLAGNEWIFYDIHSRMDQLTAILVLVRDSKKVKANFHARESINGVIELIFNIQGQVFDFIEGGE